MRELLTPPEFFFWQIAGYAVFALAGAFIPIAIAHGIRELRPQRLVRRRPRSIGSTTRPKPQPIPFPVRAGRVLMFPVARKAAPHA